MTKYEELIKQKATNKEPTDIDALAKKYKMNVMDVKKLKDIPKVIKNLPEDNMVIMEDRGPGDLTKIIDQYEQQLKDADAKMITKLEEINELKNKIADLEESLHSKEYWEKPDYKFLVNENLDLRRKITELEQEVLEVKVDNKKLAQQITTMMERMRDTEF